MAAQSMAGRAWPAGTKVVLHSAVGFGASPVAELMLPEDCNRAQSMLEPVANILREAGLEVSTSVFEEDPKNSIVNVAEKMVADCIFVGDNDETALDRLLLGTVASAVVSRAPCSVEIIR
jgi:nucleotide-binding universal stress UspA family protein